MLKILSSLFNPRYGSDFDKIGICKQISNYHNLLIYISITVFFFVYKNERNKKKTFQIDGNALIALIHKNIQKRKEKKIEYNN